MSGKDIKIKKLFKNKKKLVISALDHVVEYGVQPEIEDARKAIKNCIATDALLLPRFMLKRNWDLFCTANSPVPIVRINWSSSFYYPLNYREGYTTICTNVEEAVEEVEDTLDDDMEVVEEAVEEGEELEGDETMSPEDSLEDDIGLPFDVG